jgi:hypothetical protein
MIRTALAASIAVCLASTSASAAPTTVPAPVPIANDSAPAVPPPPYAPSKRTKSLVLGGSLALGYAYICTSLAGAIAIDKAKRAGHDDPLTIEVEHGVDRRRRAFGRALLVPVAGPFLALGYTDSALRRWAAAFAGGAQLLGVAMIAAGVIAGGRERRARRLQPMASWQPGGATFGISGRF